jgi:hypothetical protein
MYEMISSLVKGQVITFNYGRKTYKLGIHSESDGTKHMNVREVGKYGVESTMNVGKATKNIIWLYDYNMMGVRSEGKMYTSNITDITLMDAQGVIREGGMSVNI